MNSYHRKVRNFIKNNYHVYPKYIRRSRHPRFEFEYQGIRRIITMHNDNRETNIFDLKRQDIIRELGQPNSEQLLRQRRSLEDMTAELETKPFNPIPLVQNEPKVNSEQLLKYDEAVIGGIALYKKNSGFELRFFIPDEIIKKANLLDKYYNVVCTSKYNWEITKAANGPKCTTNILCTTRSFAYTGLRPFGISPAQYLFVDGTILVGLNPTDIKPIHPILTKARREAVATTAAMPAMPAATQSILRPPETPGPRPLATPAGAPRKVPAAPVAAPRVPVPASHAALAAPASHAAPAPAASGGFAATAEAMHQLLEHLRYIEANTPYRLRKRSENGMWVFTAPSVD